MIFTADYDFNFFNFVSISLGFVFLSLLNLEVSQYYIDEHVQLLPQISGQKLHDDK